MPAIVDRASGDVLMLVDDAEDAETIMVELRRAGVSADVVKQPPKQVRDPNWD